MPTFQSFRILGLFPECATENEVSLFFEGSTEKTSSTSIMTAKYSLPMYWLLYKIRFNIDYSATINGNSESGSSILEITINNSPNEIICDNSNIKSGGDATYNEGDISGYYFMQPFQNEKLHVMFYSEFDEGVADTSAGLGWYVTSDPNFSKDSALGPAGPYEAVFNNTMPITLPTGDIINLYGYVVLFTRGIEDFSVTANITFQSVEWWELEG